jgi:hypothetical protein
MSKERHQPTRLRRGRSLPTFCGGKDCGWIDEDNRCFAPKAPYPCNKRATCPKNCRPHGSIGLQKISPCCKICKNYWPL